MDLEKAINSNNRWYKNCRNVRRRGGLICKVCPFRKDIEKTEVRLGKSIPKSQKEELAQAIHDSVGEGDR